MCVGYVPRFSVHVCCSVFSPLVFSTAMRSSNWLNFALRAPGWLIAGHTADWQNVVGERLYGVLVTDLLVERVFHDVHTVYYRIVYIAHTLSFLFVRFLHEKHMVGLGQERIITPLCIYLVSKYLIISYLLFL